MPVRSSGKLYDVPELPPRYLARDLDLAGLKQKLLVDGAKVMIAGESSGQVHFLQIVEADEPKPAINETKIQFRHREEQSITQPQ